MSENKFRYVFKNKNFGDYSFYYLTLGEIERGASLKIFQSGMIENDYELISRDRYTGLKDKNGKEIYGEDLVGLWMPDEYREGYLINKSFADPFKVIWKRGGFVCEFEGETQFLDEYFDASEDLEIIGNSYENPELREIK